MTYQYLKGWTNIGHMDDLFRFEYFTILIEISGTADCKQEWVMGMEEGFRYMEGDSGYTSLETLVLITIQSVAVQKDKPTSNWDQQDIVGHGRGGGQNYSICRAEQSRQCFYDE